MHLILRCGLRPVTVLLFYIFSEVTLWRATELRAEQNRTFLVDRKLGPNKLVAAAASEIRPRKPRRQRRLSSVTSKWRWRRPFCRSGALNGHSLLLGMRLNDYPGGMLSGPVYQHNSISYITNTHLHRNCPSHGICKNHQFITGSLFLSRRKPLD